MHPIYPRSHRFERFIGLTPIRLLQCRSIGRKPQLQPLVRKSSADIDSHFHISTRCIAPDVHTAIKIALISGSTTTA